MTQCQRRMMWVRWGARAALALLLLSVPVLRAWAAGTDALSGATDISALLPYTDPGQNTTTATREAGEFGTCGFPPSGNVHSVWYQYTAAATGFLTADTLGSNYDTVLEVYSGAAPNFAALVSVACNDDVGAFAQSEVTVPVATGVTYYIAARDFNAGSGGTLVFHAAFSAQWNLYVSEATGKDTNPGSFALPVKSIKRGVQLASPGAVVNVLSTGLYADPVFIDKSLTLTSSLSIATSGVFTLTNGALLGGGTGNVTAPLVYVNPLSKIQDGVLLAEAGGALNVAAGTYTETVTIGKNLTLNGSSAATLIRPVSAAADAVVLSGGAVSISGVTLQIANAALRVTGGSGHALSGSNLLSSSAGVTNTSGIALLATNNYWGSATGPTHASNSGGSGLAVSNNVTFSPWCTQPAPACAPLTGIATQLVFTTQPSNGVAATPLPTQPVLQARDALGNVAINFNGPVTLTLGNNPGGAAIGGVNPVTAVNGVITFTNISLSNAGLGYTLVASAPGLASATSNAFNISDAPPAANPDTFTVNEDSGATNLLVLTNDTDPNGDAVHITSYTQPANGAVVTTTVALTEAMTFTPAANFFGTTTFQYSISDPYFSGYSTATVTVTVNAVNDAPSFVKGADQTVNEDAGAQNVTNWATGLSAGPANENAQTLAFTVSNSNPALFSVQPTVTVSGNAGTLAFTPAANLNGSATVTVTLQDNGGTANGGVDTSAAQTFLITVNAVNDAPQFTGGGNQTVAEDSGPQAVTSWATNLRPALPAITNENGQLLSFVILSNSNPALFSAGPSITPFNATYPTTGTLSYTPAPNANGVAALLIEMRDDGGTAFGGVNNSASHTFTITVTPVNDAPSAVADSATVNEDSGATALTVLTNDRAANVDGASEPITVTAVGAAGNGAAAIIGGGTDVTYAPNANFFGTDSFTYTVSDNALTGTATVNITVNPVNDAPAFTPGSNQTVLEDSGAQTVNGWAAGLSVGPANESAQALSFNISNNNNGLFSAQPSVSVSGTTGTLTFTPAPNAFGSASVSVTIQDSGGTANGGVDAFGPLTFTITVTGVNDAPTFANGGNRTVLEDAGLQTGNWAAPVSPGPNETQALTFTVTNSNNPLFTIQPTIDASGVLTFTPAANLNGSATMSVTLQDSGGTANSGVDTAVLQTFIITVTAVNDAPSFAISPTVTVAEDAGPQSIAGVASSIAAGPADESAQTLSFVLTNTAPALFAAQPQMNAAGLLSFTTAPNANGVVTVTVTLTDSGGTLNGGVDMSGAQAFILTITPVPDAPVAVGDSVTVLEDSGPNAALVLSNDVSVDGQPLSIITATSGANGAVTFTPTVASYAPAANYFGPDAFAYSISDGGPITASAAVTVTVLPVNDAPSFVKGADATRAEDAPAQTIGGWASTLSVGPANEASQSLAFLVTAANPSLFSVVPAINGVTGDLTFTPAPNAFGSAVITVTAQDNGGTANGGVDVSVAQTFAITLTSVDDPPTLTNDAQTVLVNSGANVIDVLANDSIAPDTGETLSITGVTQGAHGTVTNVGGLLVLYTPAADYAGPDSFTYTVTDSGGALTSTTTVNINVTLPGYRVYLPLVARPSVTLPDLVTRFSLSPANPTLASTPVTITVVITNQGSAAAGPFWLDFYINPTVAPTAPNVQWNTVCSFAAPQCYGIAWYVPVALAPGQSITLTSTPGGYCANNPSPTNPQGYCDANTIWPGHFASGTSDLYLFADSFNPGVVTGAVLESDETNNRFEQHGLAVTGPNAPDNEKRLPLDLPERGMGGEQK